MQERLPGSKSMSSKAAFEPTNEVGFRTMEEISKMCRAEERIKSGKKVLSTLSLPELAQLLSELDCQLLQIGN